MDMHAGGCACMCWLRVQGRGRCQVSSSMTLYLSLWDRVSQWSLVIQIDWLPRESHILPLPPQHWNYRLACTYRTLMWVLENWNQILILGCKQIGPQSPPEPKCLGFACSTTISVSDCIIYEFLPHALSYFLMKSLWTLFYLRWDLPV